MKLLVIICAVFALSCPRGPAAVALPRIFGDNMVLQRDMPAPVWGSADPAEEITVKFAGQTKSTRADADGHWQILLDPLAASDAPRDLTVAGTNTIALGDVLVGEVWLCSGQSNMEMAVDRPTAGAKPATAWSPGLAEEIAKNEHPNIRLFRVEKKIEPPDVVSAGWQPCAGEARAMFSAIGYAFALELQQKLKVPIGMIQSAWGGSRIEVWTPPEAYAASPKFATEAATKPVKIDEVEPGRNYNGMVRPLAPFALRGVLWYQGESQITQCNDGLRYADKFQVLVDAWRKAWTRSDLPFFSVQLAPFLYSERTKDKLAHGTDELPKLWEAQERALTIPHTAMVSITDTVENLRDIHPGKKEIIGARLADIALGRVYRLGKEPMLPAFERAEPAGAEIRVRFRGDGFRSSDGKPLTEFEIAGSDQQYVPATAELRNDIIVLTNSQVKEPRFVRFAWRETAQPNLVNGDGWPAYPFRSDGPSWP